MKKAGISMKWLATTVLSMQRFSSSALHEAKVKRFQVSKRNAAVV
jgi:hypothetical protein